MPDSGRHAMTYCAMIAPITLQDVIVLLHVGSLPPVLTPALPAGAATYTLPVGTYDISLKVN